MVKSWLLDLSADALARHLDLSSFSGFVQDSGEGRWTVQAAKAMNSEAVREHLAQAIPRSAEIARFDEEE